MPETINQRIKLSRKRTGLTLKEMAEKLNIKPSTYASMEKNGKTFKTEVILKIAEILNVSSNYLITGEKDDGANENYSASKADNSSGTVVMRQTPVIPKVDPVELILSAKQRKLFTMMQTFSKEDNDRIYKLADELYRGKKEKTDI